MLLQELQQCGIRLSLDDGRIAVTGPLTNEQRRTINKNKPVLKAELRREAVLKMLAEDLMRPQAWYVDSDSDPHYVILAFAKRVSEEIYTCELTVEREKWDPFLFLELIAREH